MADHIGQQLGNYRLTRLIGRGGFADVYLGEHVYLNTQVAVKLLQTRVADNELESFLMEARTIAHLVHPQIVRVMDFGVERENPFLVMDYAPNGTLRQRHPIGVQLAPSIVVPYVKQVAAALQYAHDEKFIHRDIKPENMLLGRRNEVLLSDFGIALIAQSSRYQHTSEVAGTVSYMAPEQIQGKPRPASDQYALAVVVYEWLSGDRPFRGSFSEVCAQHMFATPPSLREKISTVSPAVEEVVLTAMAKDPSRRFKSVQAFANALEQASRLERSTGQDIQPSFPPITAEPDVPIEQPIVKPSLTPTPQTPQVLPLTPPLSEENSSPSPVLKPAGFSSPTPRLPAEISAPPGAETVQSETSSRVDEGATTVAEEPATKASEEQRAVAGSHSEKVRVWHAWSIGKGQVLAMILGIILFGAVNYPINLLYKEDSPLMVTSLSFFNASIDSGIVVIIGVALVIPLFFGAVFGPWAGLITVLGGTYLGTFLADYNAPSDYYGVSWTLLAGQLLIGFIAGLAFLKTQGRYTTGSAIAYAVVFCAVGILVGLVFATFATIWISGITVGQALTDLLALAIPAAINLMLFLLLLFAYNTAVKQLNGVQFSKRS